MQRAFRRVCGTAWLCAASLCPLASAQTPSLHLQFEHALVGQAVGSPEIQAGSFAGDWPAIQRHQHATMRHGAGVPMFADGSRASSVTPTIATPAMSVVACECIAMPPVRSVRIAPAFLIVYSASLNCEGCGDCTDCNVFVVELESRG